MFILSELKKNPTNTDMLETTANDAVHMPELVCHHRFSAWRWKKKNTLSTPWLCPNSWSMSFKVCILHLP